MGRLLIVQFVLKAGEKYEAVDITAYRTKQLEQKVWRIVFWKVVWMPRAMIIITCGQESDSLP